MLSLFMVSFHTFDEKGKKLSETEQKGSAAASICGAVTSGLDAAIRSEYYGARENEAREAAFSKSMERHHKKREHLNNALEKHSNAKIGEVDIRLQRSPVVSTSPIMGLDSSSRSDPPSSPNSISYN